MSQASAGLCHPLLSVRNIELLFLVGASRVFVSIGPNCDVGHVFLRAMFLSEMSEAKQELIVIKDFDGDAIQDLVQFAYSSKLILTVDNVQPLLYAACILQVKPTRITTASRPNAWLFCSSLSFLISA